MRHRQLRCAQCCAVFEATGNRSTYCEACRDARTYAAWLDSPAGHKNASSADEWFILATRDALVRERAEGERAIRVALRDGVVPHYHEPPFATEIALLDMAIRRARLAA